MAKIKNTANVLNEKINTLHIPITSISMRSWPSAHAWKAMNIDLGETTHAKKRSPPLAM